MSNRKTFEGPSSKSGLTKEAAWRLARTVPAEVISAVKNDPLHGHQFQSVWRH